MLDISIYQIKYCVETGLFKNPEDAIVLCDCLISFVKHLGDMAMLGRKFPVGRKAWKSSAKFEIYFNEIAHSTNAVVVTSDQEEFAFVSMDNPYYIHTQSEATIEYLKDWFERVKNSSLPISKEARRTRLQLIKSYTKKINLLKKELKNNL